MLAITFGLLYNKYTITSFLTDSGFDSSYSGGSSVRGSDTVPITMHYELVFTSSSNGIVDKCPKCGSNLSDKITQTCPYCRHQITQDSTNWVMSKKIVKGQR